LIVLFWGLKPFNFHSDNGVYWLENENGIGFNTRGIVYGPVGFRDLGQIPFLKKNEPFSIELWLRPGSDGHNRFSTIFGLYDDHYQEIFSFSQVKSLLNVSNGQNALKKGVTHNWRWFGNAFFKEQKRFISIISDKTSTTIYLNGKKARKFRNFSLIPSKELRPKWRIVAGNDPTGKKPWTGKIYGLAIYNHLLSSKQVSEHFKNWKGESVLSLLKEKEILALYPMNEKNGISIRNVMNGDHNMLIPAKFKILKKNFLKLPCNALMLNGSNSRDIGINILGFIPLGFLLFLAINSYSNPLKTSAWCLLISAILGGIIVSLIIETLQVYLPDRHSSVTDLIFNALGTGLGVIFALIFKRNLAKIE
jgi:hypothetical protein